MDVSILWPIPFDFDAFQPTESTILLRCRSMRSVIASMNCEQSWKACFPIFGESVRKADRIGEWNMLNLLYAIQSRSSIYQDGLKERSAAALSNSWTRISADSARMFMMSVN